MRLLNRFRALAGKWGSRCLRGLAAREFHKAYFYSEVWQRTRWLGVPVYKTPLDLWVMQELLYEVRPDFVVESGTNRGGSALFFAHLCELLGQGEVISIDCRAIASRPSHSRIHYLSGSSLDPAIARAVRERLGEGKRVLVNLDSDHRAEHVRRELEIYCELVSPGSYLILEDTMLNGHPVHDDGSDWGPGPMEALRDFLKAHPDFVSDREREKFFFSFNPRGYLRRTGGNRG